MSDADVKAKVARVYGLMGMPADESARLIYSWEAVPHTTSHPIERRYVRIPDEQVARVADRIAELEAELAQFKEWKSGFPKLNGDYWVKKPSGQIVGPFPFFNEKIWLAPFEGYREEAIPNDWEFRKAR